MRFVLAALLLAAAPALAQPQSETMTTKSPLPPPPVAEQRPYSFERHGVTIQDPYHWLRDSSYPTVDDADVLSYLRAENAYFEAAMAPHRALTDTLFAEMRGRIPEDDSSVPQRDGDWLYWWAFTPGAQYRTWYRRPVAGGEQQLVFDEPAVVQQLPHSRPQLAPRARLLRLGLRLLARRRRRLRLGAAGRARRAQ